MAGCHAALNALFISKKAQAVVHLVMLEDSQKEIRECAADSVDLP
jgi:hypothetical protein